jgi:hypothetical protein
VAGGVLTWALVWPVAVEMTDVLVDDGGSKSFVVISSRSVHSTRTLPTNRSA